MDIQVMSEHMKAFGATEITRAKFKKKLAEVQSASHRFGPTEPFTDPKVFNYGDFSKLIV
jgi:Leu/Phe-tRNA-protein transferase